MKSIKAVASDLDGTLLLSKNSIGAFTELVINRLVKEGKKFIISTGRSKNEIIDLIRNLKLHDTFFITLNGAKVYDSKWNPVIGYDLDPEVIFNILKTRNKYANLIYFLYKSNNGNNEKLYFDSISKRSIEKQIKTTPNDYEYIIHHIKKANIKEINNFYNLENFLNVSKIIVVGLEKNLIKYEGMILKKYEKNINAYISTPNSLEIVNNNVSKGSALKSVLKKFNISLKETIAFGDGFNDVDMLKNVKKGLIMSNANYRLKKILPHLEIIGTNDEESVANYINENILENQIKS